MKEENDNKLYAGIKVDICYGYDEEYGYNLDTDGIRADFEEALTAIEDDIQNRNHERNEHLRTKHMEG
jgi:hypothetical protein